MAARTINLMLALWLISSAFAMPRGAASAANAWILGVVISILSVASMLRKVWLRYVNTALSAWLLASAFLLPQRSSLAVWNDVLVALAMLAVSLVPGSMYAPTELRRRRPAAAQA